MKKLIALASLLLGVNFAASAATCAYNQRDGRWYGDHPSCDARGVPNDIAYQNDRVMVLRSAPAGVTYRECTTEERVMRSGLAALTGGVAGVLIGDNRRSAGIGAGLGVLFSMGSVCQRAILTERQQFASNADVVDGRYNDRRRTHREPADCDVEGYPELQNLDVSKADCASKAESKRTTVPAKCDFGNGVVAYSYEGRAGCDKIAASMVQRVEAPQVVSQTRTATPSAVAATPRDNTVRACRYSKGPGSPVLAVSVPDPNNPSWTLKPTNPGETCQEWKARIETSVG
ncbi:MAG: hypothetical protein ACAH17_02365 [Candidatus Paceibacterota bacterium]